MSRNKKSLYFLSMTVDYRLHYRLLPSNIVYYLQLPFITAYYRLLPFMFVPQWPLLPGRALAWMINRTCCASMQRHTFTQGQE